MPSVEIPIRELRARHVEVPVGLDAEDCYLVSVLAEDGEELGSTRAQLDEGREGVFPIPYRADRVDILNTARYENDKEWAYTIGGDSCRMGCNTPSVSTNARLVFRWGEGHPGGILPCRPPSDLPSDFPYCGFCGKESSGQPFDCKGRRLRALVEAFERSEASGDTDSVWSEVEKVREHHPKLWTGRMFG